MMVVGEEDAGDGSIYEEKAPDAFSSRAVSAN
jgi:hypothetical protein